MQEVCDFERADIISDRFLRKFSFYTLIPDAVRVLKLQGVVNSEGWNAEEITARLRLDTAPGLKPVYDLAQEIQNELPNQVHQDIRLLVGKRLIESNPWIEPIKELFFREKGTAINRNRTTVIEALMILFKRLREPRKFVKP